jgi:hypothetical protein
MPQARWSNPGRRNRTRCEHPINGGCRGMARTSNRSVCAEQSRRSNNSRRARATVDSRTMTITRRAERPSRRGETGMVANNLPQTEVRRRIIRPTAIASFAGVKETIGGSAGIVSVGRGRCPHHWHPASTSQSGGRRHICSVSSTPWPAGRTGWQAPPPPPPPRLPGLRTPPARCARRRALTGNRRDAVATAPRRVLPNEQHDRSPDRRSFATCAENRRGGIAPTTRRPRFPSADCGRPSWIR